MKVIILDTGKTQIYLHIKKILRTYVHRYSYYTTTSIYINNYKKVYIKDHQHGDFNQLIHEFIESNENLKILKVKKLVYEKDEIHVTLVDWVSEAMGDK